MSDSERASLRRRLLQAGALSGALAASYGLGRLQGSSGSAAAVDAGGLQNLKSVQRNLPRVLPQGSRAPNVLLIVTDQERAALPRGLPLPGHEWLAAHGTVFERWHVNTTPCSPSRSNLYFGQYTQRTRIISNLGAYPDREPPIDMATLGHYFRANGYYTAYKGKWHLSHLHARHELTYGQYPNSQHALEPWGFSDFNFDGDPHGSTWTGFRVDAQIASQSAEWIRARARGSSSESSSVATAQPWCLCVNLVNPHDVMYYATGAAQIASRAHPDYLAPLAGAPDVALYRKHWDFDLPANRSDDLSSKPWAHDNYREFCDMAYGRVPDEQSSWQAYQSYYYNCIRDADQNVISILNALKESGQAGNTVVVFTSDHGEMAGAHGLRQKGPFMYDENTRVPMMVVHPDAKGGQTTRALGSAVDLIPTLLEWAGADPSRVAQAYPQLNGVSVAQAVAKPHELTQRDKRGILFNYDTTHYLDSDFIEQMVRKGIVSDKWMPARNLLKGIRPLPRLTRPALFRGLHDGRYKFARYFPATGHHVPVTLEQLLQNNQLELYDTQNDPLEMNNLAWGLTADNAKTGIAGNDATTNDSVKTVMALNAKLNALIAQEVGEDMGAELPGPDWIKRK